MGRAARSWHRLTAHNVITFFSIQLTGERRRHGRFRRGRPSPSMDAGTSIFRRMCTWRSSQTPSLRPIHQRKPMRSWTGLPRRSSCPRRQAQMPSRKSRTVGMAPYQFAAAVPHHLSPMHLPFTSFPAQMAARSFPQCAAATPSPRLFRVLPSLVRAPQTKPPLPRPPHPYLRRLI